MNQNDDDLLPLVPLLKNRTVVVTVEALKEELLRAFEAGHQEHQRLGGSAPTVMVDNAWAAECRYRIQHLINEV